MSDPHVFKDAALATQFILAGNAYFTLRSMATGTRYTFRCRRPKDSNVHFVSVMYGSDNESHYAYVGMIKDGVLALTKKSTLSPEDPRWKAIQWAWVRMYHGTMPTNLEVWHEGRCGCCGRRLTVPSSIEAGIGPECSKKLAA